MNKAKIIVPALLALTTAFGNAQSKEIAMNTTKKESANMSVGIMDKRGVPLEDVDVIAGKASAGKHIVIYYMGSDQAQWEKTQRAASEAKNMGLPVRGMILADADKSFKGGEDSFIIMIGGLPAAKQVATADYGEYAIKRFVELAAKENKNRLGIAYVDTPRNDR